jgi:hypothetical protein
MSRDIVSDVSRHHKSALGGTRTLNLRFRNRAEKVDLDESSPLNWPLWEWPSTQFVQLERMSSRGRRG